MQANINNLHENVTKLKNDTEITKSKMFSCENIAKIKKCSNLQLDLKLMIFGLFLIFLTPVLIDRISNFMMVKITINLKVILEMLSLEKRQIF